MVQTVPADRVNTVNRATADSHSVNSRDRGDLSRARKDGAEDGGVQAELG
jgi:hypothetical protein